MTLCKVHSKQLQYMISNQVAPKIAILYRLFATSPSK